MSRLGVAGSAGRVRAIGVGLCATVAVVLAASGCGSGHGGAVATQGTSTTTASAPSTSSSSALNLVPTVPNCGGGAFEPKTLLIVCGTPSPSTMATGVSWKSWDHSGATGTGTVSLQVDGRDTTAPATLALSSVVSGSVGPQFSLLTVTWTGPSPDGRAQDTYHLQTGG